jgi:formate C-acetyltransferase
MRYSVPKLSNEALERIDSLRNKSLDVVQKVCVDRARYLTEIYQDNLSDPMVILRAKALKNVLEKMTINIDDNELIVGNQAGKLRAAPIFPEYTVDWIIEEIDELSQRPGDRFEVDPSVREELLQICKWWQGRTLHDRCLATLPENVKKAYEIGVLSANGNMTSGDGHILLDFPKILNVGVNGLITEVQAAIESLDKTDPDSFKKSQVLKSILIAYEGVLNFSARYAALAEDMSDEATDQRRKMELKNIASICRAVPENPPQNFREALQSVWFMHLISQIESNGHSMSLGRFDQYMYDFYRNDIDSGKITDPEVVELLALLWIKMFGITKIRPRNHTRFSGGGPTYQNLTLGGIHVNGRDATNELTLLCLDAVSLTRLTQPNVSARIHPGAPPLYLRKCIDVIKLGFGMPALHNDELMIPSLLARGVTLEDANNYAIVGCIEPIIPGKHGYRAAGMSFTNFAKIFEISLNGGKDPRTGIILNSDEKDLTSFESFDEVMAAFQKQMAHFVYLRIQGEHVIDNAIEELLPEPFCAGLVEDCIKRGKTPKEGGAVYDMVTGPETGVPNVGNSLAAIKKLVFDESLITGTELQGALESNFSGGHGEQIRQMLLNKAPKFGNDDNYVDELANETYMIFIRELSKYKNARHGRGPIGCVSYPCTATISGNVPSGIKVGATPDGRKAGEPLSEGCSPYRGTDRLGPTAVLKSVAKMPNLLITGGNLLNQKLNPSSLESEEGMRKLEDLVRAFFEMKGWHVQFNVISKDTLRAAQKEPEKFRDLVVRVAGYSALFTMLEPDTQEDIIMRTEHAI